MANIVIYLNVFVLEKKLWQLGDGKKKFVRKMKQEKVVYSK